MLNVKWSLEADYVQACNCDYGCPCEFEAPPTTGICQGTSAWLIREGKFGNVGLDGLGICACIDVPGPLHKGNGTIKWFYDERATAEQRDALLKLTTGQAGGMPFEIFTMVFNKVLDPVYAPMKFEVSGLTATVKIGKEISVRTEPIKNPVTGTDEQIRVEHGTGFMFKSAECVSAAENVINTSGMKFTHPNKAGFIAAVSYKN